MMQSNESEHDSDDDITEVVDAGITKFARQKEFSAADPLDAAGITDALDEAITPIILPDELRLPNAAELFMQQGAEKRLTANASDIAFKQVIHGMLTSQQLQKLCKNKKARNIPAYMDEKALLIEVEKDESQGVTIRYFTSAERVLVLTMEPSFYASLPRHLDMYLRLESIGYVDYSTSTVIQDLIETALRDANLTEEGFSVLSKGNLGPFIRSLQTAANAQLLKELTAYQARLDGRDESRTIYGAHYQGAGAGAAAFFVGTLVKVFECLSSCLHFLEKALEHLKNANNKIIARSTDSKKISVGSFIGCMKEKEKEKEAGNAPGNRFSISTSLRNVLDVDSSVKKTAGPTLFGYYNRFCRMEKSEEAVQEYFDTLQPMGV